MKPEPEPASPSCRVRVLVPESGDIEVAQIVQTTGSVQLDRECVNAAISRHLEPYTLGGMAVDRWMVLPFSWTGGFPVPGPAEVRVAESNRLPEFDDQQFNVGGPYYPEEALRQHAQALCGMQIAVSASGDVDSIRITQSTGVTAMDTASVDAMYAAKLIPAQQDGKPVPAISDVWLAWRLPK